MFIHARIDFIRQNLTSTDVRIWRIKSIPDLKTTIVVTSGLKVKSALQKTCIVKIIRYRSLFHGAHYSNTKVVCTPTINQTANSANTTMSQWWGSVRDIGATMKYSWFIDSVIQGQSVIYTNKTSVWFKRRYCVHRINNWTDKSPI